MVIKARSDRAIGNMYIPFFSVSTCIISCHAAKVKKFLSFFPLASILFPISLARCATVRAATFAMGLRKLTIADAGFLLSSLVVLFCSGFLCHFYLPLENFKLTHGNH